MLDKQKIIDWAWSQVGYKEAYDNITKYAEYMDKLNLYNGKKNGFAWCDVFVDCGFCICYGVETGWKMTYNGDCGAGCYYSREYYRQAGALYDSPKPGDQVFFGTYHTGIVVEVSESYFVTVEGNSSNAVQSHTYPIKGNYTFGRPNWALDGPNVTYEETNENVCVVDYAHEFDKSKAGLYYVTPSNGLNMRAGAGTHKTILTALPMGTPFRCYGYFSYANDASPWLYGVANGYTGFCKASYLRKA